MDDALKTLIREKLVARRAEQFQFLRGLVATHSENPPGDSDAVAETTAAALKRLGFGVERHRVPNELAAEHGVARVTNLVSRHVFGAGNVIALNARGDTPPAGGGWSVDPFAADIKKGVITGLGVLGKADIAAYAYALLALRDAKPDLAGTVELHVTFDGETGGELGPLWLLRKGIVNPDYAIGSGLAHGIGTSTMGDLQMEVEIEARDIARDVARDVAREPAGAAGVTVAADAMAVASGIINALYDMNHAFANIRSSVPGIGTPSLVVGEIEGGRRPDKRPERVVFRLDRRIIPDETPATVEKSLTRLIAEVGSLEDGIVCRIRRLKLAPPMKPMAGSGRLAGILERQASETTGRAVKPYGVTFDAGARHYAGQGVPTVLYGAGPATAAAGNMGGPDERLDLDDLRIATEVIALTLAEFLKPTG
ncbi:MAG TPA: M20/M25/M40 family metallo-hydrolase [Rhodospirillales bacterium]